MEQSTTRWLDNGVGMIDLQFQRRPALIASYVIETSAGLALIDTGPGSTVERLEAGLVELGLNPADLRHLLVTHIHLDHAGAAGILMERFPDARLYVHEIGAPHMIDPERLLRSASRIYGALMGPLWGAFLPCPAERVTALTGGEKIELGDLRMDVLYTPGHASHHVSFFDQERGVIFAGDVAGVKVPPSSLVWPPTPPPDVDVSAWHESTRQLRATTPRRLYIAHYGPVDDVLQSLDQLDQRLDEFTALIARWQRDGRSRDEMIQLIEERIEAILSGAGESLSTMGDISLVTPATMTVDGILRYLRRREPANG